MIPQELQYWFEKLKQDLIASYNAKGFRASGNYEQSLVIFDEENAGNITAGIKAANYAYFMENGRGKTINKTQGTPTLQQRIRQWIDDKGIIPTKGTKESLSWAISKKIHKDGWKVIGARANVISGVITTERISELNKILFTAYAQNFTSDVIKAFKK